VEVELAVGASLDRTLSHVRSIQAAMMVHRSVARVHWFLGQSAPTFFYNVVPRRFNASFYAQAIVELKPGVNSPEVIRKLQRDLGIKFTESRLLVRQLEQGPPFDAPIEIRVFGPDLATLQRLGSQLRLLLSQTAEVIHTRSDLEESLPKLALHVDEAEAALAGLSRNEIARQLYTSVEGIVSGSLLEETEELPIRVRLSKRDRGSLDRIAAVEFQSSLPQLSLGPAAAMFPSRFGSDPVAASGPSLATLARPSLQSDVGSIQRFNRQRVNEVKAYITAGTLPAQVIAEFQQRLAASDWQLPPGYSLQYGGEEAKRNTAVDDLLADLAVLVALMFAALVLSFRSFRVALIVGAVGGLSMGLGLGALWFFGYPFGFMAIVGTMGLVGVAINDAIVVMAGIRDCPEARCGDPRALREVVVHCTRHVVATTLTTMAGFTPLVMGGGGFWPPLAITIAGGVGGSTILALYFVPSLYLLVGGGGADPRGEEVEEAGGVATPLNS
jgi:multidrug efflux pump subunit AcrB